VEPDSWRRYIGIGGEPRWLQPDRAATVSTGRWTDRWFIEIDLGTESLPTLLGKCGYYETYRQTGIEQETTGGIRTVMLDPERASWVRWIFEQYATGNWTVGMLHEELAEQGVTSLPKPNRPSRP
jgi:hypothetical protein